MNIKKIDFVIFIVSLFLTNHLLANPLTIVSYNVANYMDDSDWPKRLTLLVDEIENNHADVIVLQEIRFNPDELSTAINYETMAEQILKKLNAKGDFLSAQLITQPAMYYPIDLNYQTTHNYSLPAKLSNNYTSYYWEGLSIISKLPVIETGSYFFTRASDCSDNNRRILQYVTLDNGGQPFNLINVHFALGKSCYASNIRETIAYLARFDKKTPLLLMGDMNATPDDTDIQSLATADLTDVWANQHANLLGYTFPSSAPSKRIDYMWANQTLMAAVTLSGQIQLIGENKVKSTYPSDHLGIALKIDTSTFSSH